MRRPVLFSWLFQFWTKCYQCNIVVLRNAIILANSQLIGLCCVLTVFSFIQITVPYVLFSPRHTSRDSMKTWFPTWSPFLLIVGVFICVVVQFDLQLEPSLHGRWSFSYFFVWSSKLITWYNLPAAADYASAATSNDNWTHFSSGPAFECEFRNRIYIMEVYVLTAKYAARMSCQGRFSTFFFLASQWTWLKGKIANFQDVRGQLQRSCRSVHFTASNQQVVRWV